MPTMKLGSNRVNEGMREWDDFLPSPQPGHIPLYPILDIHDHDTGVNYCVANFLLSAIEIFPSE
jgi:hypothetical protein